MLIHAVNTYLSVRRTAGFKLRSSEQYLRYFVRFANTRGDTHVCVKTAIAWAAMARTEAERHRRLRTVTNFARFMRAEDPRHEIPPDAVFCGQHQRPSPYIFTDDELRRLLLLTSRLGPPGSLRPHTYSTLFTLLAVTGMRPSEPLALRLQDITPDGLVIRETKFRKSRLVPVHETTLAAVERYLQRRRRMAGNDEHLFVSLARRKLSLVSASRTFRQIVKTAGLPHRPRRPRLYDLRHWFATRTLERCPDNRDGVRQHMLALTTYLGHSHIESTYWYLENTPQLMTVIAMRCEAFVSGGAL